MRYEQRLIWVLGITFGFLFFDRNAASFLMPFIAGSVRPPGSRSLQPDLRELARW